MTKTDDGHVSMRTNGQIATCFNQAKHLPASEMVSDLSLMRSHASSNHRRIPYRCGLFMMMIIMAAENGRAQKLWTTDFSDSTGWSNAQYGTTMMLADVYGDGPADVCGRGKAGIWCSASKETHFAGATHASRAFADTSGWNQPVYYGSIRLADVNGDGRADVCGRKGPGVWCALSAVTVSFR
jgi:hypothetical protein